MSDPLLNTAPGEYSPREPEGAPNAAVESPILEIRHLAKHFPIEKGFLRRQIGVVKAVDDVSFSIGAGEVFGLVGESGCGKTTLGRCVTRLYDSTAGSIRYFGTDGKAIDLHELNRKEMQPHRRDIQIIFQDPFASLDPRMSVLDIVGEPLLYAGRKSRDEIEERVKHVMSVVGLEVKHLNRYPHAFSGGQRQRIGIARALATNPRFVVADEAVSALDVSIQAQILNLLQNLQKDFSLTYLFISHDLSVVQHISDRVGVMYTGKLVELARTEELFAAPAHPYTEALLSAVPDPDPDVKGDRIILRGEVANPANPPTGCYFHPRCKFAEAICRTTAPPMVEKTPGHFAVCHFAQKLELRGVHHDSKDA